MSGGGLRLLALHDWPGNIRELEHEVTKLAAFSSGEVIDEAGIRANAGFLSRPETGSAAPASSISLEETEIRQIRKALEMAGGNRTHAARLLGINRATLHRKLRRYEID
jgi:two-component system response regulator HydG